MPDWDDEGYTVRNRLFRNNTTLDRLASMPVTKRQAMYVLEDPNNTLSIAKNGVYSRSELLLVRTKQSETL